MLHTGNILKKYLNITCKVRRHVNIFRLDIGGNLQILKVLRWIYFDKLNLILQRKYQKYQELEHWYITGKKSCI